MSVSLSKASGHEASLEAGYLAFVVGLCLEYPRTVEVYSLVLWRRYPFECAVVLKAVDLLLNGFAPIFSEIAVYCIFETLGYWD